MSQSAISRWTAAGRLHRIHPAVYAVGHTVIGVRGRLHAALLYAGANAMLSHHTAAYCWRITPTPPSRVHVSGPDDRRDVATVKVHRVAGLYPVHRDGVPLTPIPRTLLNLAASRPFTAVRRALAEADHRNLLIPDAVRRELGRGRAGSAALRKALDLHLPELAEAFSRLEEEFLALCQSAGIPIPEVNVCAGRGSRSSATRGRR
jgi:predicted transcriptional regulator of viral defense system